MEFKNNSKSLACIRGTTVVRGQHLPESRPLETIAHFQSSIRGYPIRSNQCILGFLSLGSLSFTPLPAKNRQVRPFSSRSEC